MIDIVYTVCFVPSYPYFNIQFSIYLSVFFLFALELVFVMHCVFILCFAAAA